MKVNGLIIAEGTSIKNLTCPSGTTFPENPTDGELFRLRGHVQLANGLYSYEIDGWNLLAKVQPMVEVGSTSEIDVNTSTAIAIPWSKTYILSSATFEVTGSKIKVLKPGDYEVYYNVSIDTSGTALFAVLKTVAFFVRLTPTGYIFNRSRSYQFAAETSNAKSSSSISFVTPLVAGDTLELCGQRMSGAGSSYTISDNCSFGIRRIG